MALNTDPAKLRRDRRALPLYFTLIGGDFMIKSEESIYSQSPDHYDSMLSIDYVQRFYSPVKELIWLKSLLLTNEKNLGERLHV